MSELIASIASLIALLSAFYARWTWSEAQKTNKIARLNMLLALKQHYSDLMLKEHEKAAIGSILKNGLYYTLLP